MRTRARRRRVNQAEMMESFKRANAKADRRMTVIKSLLIAVCFGCAVLIGLGAGHLAALNQLESSGDSFDTVQTTASFDG